MSRRLLLDRLRIVAVALVGLTIAVLMGWLLHGLFRAEPVTARRAQQITLVRPTPPPPPPPKEERPPDPPRREEVKVEQPKAEQPSPSNDHEPLKPLGIDAEGSGAGDSFGLAANKGGRDIIAIAPQTGGGRPGTALHRSLYTDALQRHVQQILARQDAMRLIDHRTYVDLWIRPDGSIERAELAGSTIVRDTATLQALESALAALAGTRVREAQPDGIPMPIRVRLLNRGAG